MEQDTVGRVRADYLHKIQKATESAISRADMVFGSAANPSKNLKRLKRRKNLLNSWLGQESTMLLLGMSLYLRLVRKSRLSSTQSNGNYTQWVKFFIRATIAAADNSINQIEGFIDLRNKNKEKIKTLGKASKNTMLVYEYIEKNPVVGIRRVADELNISFNTAAKTVEAMADLGILKQTNNQSRHRCFIYEDYIKIFDIG